MGLYLGAAEIDSVYLGTTEIVSAYLGATQVLEPTGVSDDFQRADGDLGANWTATSDGALTITSDNVVGTAASGFSGATRTAESYPGDQWSEIVVAGALGTGQFIGPTVRSDAEGQNLYAAIYYLVEDGNYRIQLFKRVSGTFTEIDMEQAPGQVASESETGWTLNGPLPAGATIQLRAAGDQIIVRVNGTRLIKVTDASISAGGAPGILAYSTPSAAGWASDTSAASAEPTAPIRTYTTAPPNNAANSGTGYPFTYRVLEPVRPVPGVAHNFLYVLTVDAPGDPGFGDPLDLLYGLNAHNEYNLTIIEAAFRASPADGLGPWYANNVNDSTMTYETFMASDLPPWVTQTFAKSHSEEHWLLGFSRSGFGGLGLLFKHPTVFDKGAFWDWPFDMTTSTYDDDGAGLDVYGTAANFTSNYQMTADYLAQYAAPFQDTTRIWIGGWERFEADATDADAALTTAGILHTFDPQIERSHAWTSGWVTNALAGLAAM